jgi:hypothetical protein
MLTARGSLFEFQPTLSDGIRGVPCLGEGIKQRLAIGEVTPRRAMANADLGRELPQRQLPPRGLWLARQRPRVRGPASHPSFELALGPQPVSVNP